MTRKMTICISALSIIFVLFYILCRDHNPKTPDYINVDFIGMKYDSVVSIFGEPAASEDGFLSDAQSIDRNVFGEDRFIRQCTWIYNRNKYFTLEFNKANTVVRDYGLARIPRNKNRGMLQIITDFFNRF